MVACRITDARNAANHTASASSSQVPLKKYKKARISGVIHVFVAILHWIWPPDRCTNCHSVYRMPKTNPNVQLHSVGEIHRSVDGRFVLSSELDQDITDGELHEIDERRQSTSESQYTSSDDGGFLPRRRNTDMRSSWRRPLVASSSQLSFRSENSVSSFLQSLGDFFRQNGNYKRNQNNIAEYQNIYKKLPSPQMQPRLNQNLHINTVTNNVPQLLVSPNMYTPSRVSRIFSSSPASTIGVQTTPWQQTANQFSDLSTVYPGSAERSFPTPSSHSNFNNRFRYSHELPSLRTIQEETRRMNQGFVPLHIPSPSWKGYYHTQTPYHSYRPRTRWYPRHFNRNIIRNNIGVLSPLPHLNLSMRGTNQFGSGIEVSPESRSSSSGFGSKNTSTHNQPHQGSHHSNSTSEWRLLPPYRPPPPPHYHPYYPSLSNLNYNTLLQAPSKISQNQHNPPLLQQYEQQPPSPPYTMENWLDMISRLNAATETTNIHKSVDVGSVDGHYEFDPSTPTPSASTPTGNPRDEIAFDSSFIGSNALGHHWGTTVSGVGGTTGPSMMTFSGATTGVRKQRVSRYDNIESRLQAMKEEFYAYRKRQAMKRAGVELESAC